MKIALKSTWRKNVQNLVTLDFETYYDTKLSLTKLTTMDYVRHEKFKVWGVGIKINDEPTEWFGEDETEDALHSIDWANTRLVCHNTPFDGYILTNYYKLIPAYYCDTAAMARGANPGQSARLKDVAERLFPNDPSMRKGDELINAKGIYDLPPDIEEQIAGYCIQDVDLTYAIYNQFMKSYPEREMDLIDLTTRMFCEPTLKIDRERLTTYHEQEFNNAEQLIAASGYDRKQLASNQQFSEIIESLGITVPTKPSPSKPDTKIPALGKNDAGFKQMAAMYPEHQHLWDARVAVKSRLTETRSKRFLDAADDNDFIPAPLRYYAAHTGRFGGTEKLNMQNLPRGGELRQCLMAPKGHLIYVADLSNIEARMLAWLAGETDLVEQFRNGEDIYSNFASVIYDTPINKKDNPTERFVGKTAILGLGYGMGAEKFQATLKSGAMGPPIEFELSKTKEIVNKYRSTYPGIKNLWYKLEDKLRLSLHKDNYSMTYGPLTVDHESLILPNGMALRYHNLRTTRDGLTFDSRNKPEYTYGGKITENVVQALSRIVITDSMLRLSKSIPNGKVALTVHDEIIIVAPDTDPHATMTKIIDDMCQAPAWCSDIPLDAEGGFDIRYSK
jgi:DNA polymerase